MTQIARDDAESQKTQNVFGKVANYIDSSFASRFYRIGLFVGTRPGASIGLSFLFVLVCCGGFSMTKTESRSEKLWIPQDTIAQDHQAMYDVHFPPASRIETALLEAKSGSVLDKAFLTAAMEMHTKVEALTSIKYNDTLRTLCIAKFGQGHPCLINSVLSFWSFSPALLAADANPLATINAGGKTQDDLNRMVGGATFAADGKLVSAKALSIMYFLMSNRVQSNGGYSDPRGAAWEKEYLELFMCDEPICEGNRCACGYESSLFKAFAFATRSRGDAFGNVIRGDVGLINGAFAIIIIFMVLNLGGLCHKIRSRALLALGSVLSIVLAGAAGYGLAMYCQFIYTPVMSVLPFVLLGIGVDDSFVIMNALDRVDKNLPIPERIAKAIAHAGASVMVTSLTDFVAFAISVSSGLPALSAFCMYAAFSIIVLFFLQITLFGAFAALDARRVAANRIDCCPCLCRRGCPCCRVVALEDGKVYEKDPNQMCFRASGHVGGRFGYLLEKKIAPVLVKTPVALAVVAVALGFSGICAWQASILPVEDASGKFIPDDSYALASLEKQDEYFGDQGQSVYIVTQGGDYFATQSGLTSIRARLGSLWYIQDTAGDKFDSWADSFQGAIRAGSTGATVSFNSMGHATNQVEYYAGLKAWLGGAGKSYAKDVKWVDDSNPQKGVASSRMSAEFKSYKRDVNGKLIQDADKAIEIMDGLRDTVASWKDMPGTDAFPYTYQFLSWEVFRIIKKELLVNVGMCLAAVFFITLILLAHPWTAFLVFAIVVMVIVDVLGCMNMWGLAIDNVSVIQLVISVGLSVDYAAHVAHCFMTKAGTRQERVIDTLGDVGSAVMKGGASTFLAVCLLGASKSYVFRVLFQTFFLTVVLGLSHGLLVMPAILSLVGPEGYSGTERKDKVVAHQTLGKEVEAA
ncbi:unnamed protein product [Polarella glacialis]|uniref:SSD domain-containing protein n=1 Tax=Polarella glacialis TaxID=89957 RepID=A0A813INV5_POLGL|nr:unnamed protein product [Polarella glacialis]